jgi:ketopantoate reductase
MMPGALARSICSCFNAEVSLDIGREIWQKFVFLVALPGRTASMRAAIGKIRENPLTRQFLLDLMKEVVAVVPVALRCRKTTPSSGLSSPMGFLRT